MPDSLSNMAEANKSEIRHSVIRDLIDKVRKQNYGNYLLGMRLERFRQFKGARITFDFPVTAIIGPNGGGKSTILGAAMCAYSEAIPKYVFRRSKVGDETMDGWIAEFDLIDKELDPKGTLRSTLTLTADEWKRSREIVRAVKVFSINRTVPAIENPEFSHRRKLSVGTDKKRDGEVTLTTEKVADISSVRAEAEKILGRSLEKFDLYKLTFKTVFQRVKSRLVRTEVQDNGTILEMREKAMGANPPTIRTSQAFMFVGHNGVCSYSEFNFGSGEASVIRTVAAMEAMPDNSLIVIEEIENGLHPLAVKRMVEYLIDFAKRKSGQVIFSTHSDYALLPLPPEAIWASFDGALRQGALDIESLRAISGRIDKRLAIFVEDEFARNWLLAVLREMLGNSVDEIGIYSVKGDGNAKHTHLSHMKNPSVAFRSFCYLDGDSQQSEDDSSGVLRLPGKAAPETVVFNSVLEKLDEQAALLTVACQRAISAQIEVSKAIREVSKTNRDPHLLYNQIGEKIGFVSESIVRGAFLSVWIHQNKEAATKIAAPLALALKLSLTAREA
jgi:predicted ATPase